MKLAAGTRLGSYEVLGSLGAGGMGEVYRARDLKLGREVALKVLPEEVAGNPDRLSRFEQEARAASALNHPTIITIYDVGQAGAISYIAMELVEGRTLREMLIEGPLPIRRILGIGAQAAEGLAKAHAAGIVHRDLKPENLMVSQDGYVKILDFGLSKLAAAETGGLSAMPTLAKPETQPGTVLGTVAYMSPEQASGNPVDYRSDQFSLGSILYEAIGGEKAFQESSAAETMSAIIRQDPEPLAKRRPDAPLPLRWIVERCLEKDPEERYASTRDLARDLAVARDHISEISSGEAALLAAPAARGRRKLSLLLAVGLLAAGLLAGGLAVRALSKPLSRAPSFTRLTYRRGEIANARFAPDGQSVVYGARWVGEGNRLYLSRLDSPESRPFDFPPADILAISSSGEMAINLGEQPVGVLARAPLTGGAPREVVEGIPYASADWAPDGKNLSIVRVVPGRRRLEYPIGTVILETLEDIYAPRISPSGDEIAFYEGRSRLSVVKVPGKEKRTLAEGWTDVFGEPCWSPDGREVWISATEPGHTNGLYAIDRSGRKRLVLRVPGSLELDDISRDGRVLAAHHTVVMVLQAYLAGGEKERDLAWLDGSVPVALSDDAKTLVFTEIGEAARGGPAVYLRRTDGSPALRLGEGTGLALSPDGKTVLAVVRSSRDRAEHLVLLPTGAGEPKALPNDGLESFGEILRIPSRAGGVFLPDGKRVLFAGNEKGHRSRIYVQDLGGGHPRPITPEGTWIRFATKPVSPDGKFVLALQEGWKASIYPIDGGEARPVAGLEPLEFPVQWTTDGRALFVYRLAGGHDVSLLDVSSGKRSPWRRITPVEAVDFLRQLVMTQDGKSYVYGAQRAISELYVIEGLK